MADARRIRNAAQWVRDVGAQLGTGNPGHDLTTPLAGLLDRFARTAELYENAHYGESGEHVEELDQLLSAIERAELNT